MSIGTNRLSFESTPAVAPTIKGAANSISIGPGCQINAIIEIDGDGNDIVIGAGCVINGYVGIVGTGCSIKFGSRTTVGAATGFHARETSSIEIGENCNISTNIFVASGDMHPIYDLASGERINPAKSIVLEDDVWVGYHAIIVKGVRIGRGSAVGAGSVVTRSMPAHCVIAGNPARVVREGIRWARDFS